jgi:hypothetical protein
MRDAAALPQAPDRVLDSRHGVVSLACALVRIHSTHVDAAPPTILSDEIE